MKNGFSLIELVIVLALLGVGAVFLLKNDFKVPERPYTKYKLASGTTIECQQTVRNNCGLSFFRCKSGLEYECQTNVEQVK